MNGDNDQLYLFLLGSDPTTINPSLLIRLISVSETNNIFMK